MEHYTALVLLVISENIAVVRYQTHLQIDMIGSERCLGQVFIEVSVGSCGMCVLSILSCQCFVSTMRRHTCSVQNWRVSLYKYGNIHLLTPFHYI